jgi:hypothetical protein
MGAIRDAISDTEDEIFRFAFDLPEEEDDPNPTDVELDDLGLEDVEGADGLPLPFEEIAHRNLYGDDENNFDRPIALAEEEANIEAHLRSNQEILGNMAQHWAQHDQAVLEARKQAIIPEVLAQPEVVVNHALALEQQVQSQRAAYVDLSFQRGHEHYGEDFERAYNKLTSLDPNNPTHRSLVQSIYHADDPTAALLNWHEHGIDARGNMSAGHRARPGMRLPSLNSQTAASTRGRSGSSRSGGLSEHELEMHGGGFGADGDEADIFGSALR